MNVFCKTYEIEGYFFIFEIAWDQDKQEWGMLARTYVTGLGFIEKRVGLSVTGTGEDGSLTQKETDDLFNVVQSEKNIKLMIADVMTALQSQTMQDALESNND